MTQALGMDNRDSQDNNRHGLMRDCQRERNDQQQRRNAERRLHSHQQGKHDGFSPRSHIRFASHAPIA